MNPWAKAAVHAGISVAVLLAAVWTVEHISGLQAWKEAQEAVTAQGESLEAPPPEPEIPDAENFCATPLLREAVTSQRAHQSIIREPASHENVFADIIATAEQRPRSRHVMREAFRPDDLTGVIFMLKAPTLWEAMPGLLAKRAERCLQDGQTQEAARVLPVISRILEADVHLEESYALFSAAGVWREEVALVASGLRNHAWGEEAITLAEKDARSIDFRALALACARRELCEAASFGDRLLANRRAALDEWSGGHSFRRMERLTQFAPGGLFRCGQARTVTSILRERIIPLRDLGLEAWSRSEKAATRVSNWRSVWEDAFFQAWTGPIPYAAHTALFAEMERRQLLVACALERAFQQTGRFPESLDGLSSAFPPEMLQDVDGRPLRYRCQPSGASYALWSVGVDGKDDSGGVPRAGVEAGRRSSEPDWHWMAP